MSMDSNNRTPLAEPGRFKSAYSIKTQTPIEFDEMSPYTRQEFKDECDINTIMAQYEKTGLITHINEEAPQYLDCTGEDFRTHMDYIAGAFSMFEELPATMRARFDNDPAEFLDFCSQEKNRPEMAQMGLLSPEATLAYATPQGSPKTPPKTAPEEPAPVKTAPPEMPPEST